MGIFFKFRPEIFEPPLVKLHLCKNGKSKLLFLQICLCVFMFVQQKASKPSFSQGIGGGDLFSRFKSKTLKSSINICSNSLIKHGLKMVSRHQLIFELFTAFSSVVREKKCAQFNFFSFRQCSVYLFSNSGGQLGSVPK